MIEARHSIAAPQPFFYDHGRISGLVDFFEQSFDEAERPADVAQTVRVVRIEKYTRA